MKNFVLFVASSNELYEDRVVLGDIVRELDDVYEPQGLRIRLKKWEDLPSYYMTERSQDAYNKKIVCSHLFVMLLHERFGKYTREEFEVAKKQDKDRLVFVKRCDGAIHPTIASDPQLDQDELIPYDHPSELKSRIEAKIEAALKSGLCDEQVPHKEPCEVIRIAINDALHKNNHFDGICIRDAVRMLSDLYEQYGKRIRVMSRDRTKQDIFIALINGAEDELCTELKGQLEEATRAYHEVKHPLVYMYVRQFNEKLFSHIEQTYTHFPRAYTTEESLKLYLITELQHTHLRGGGPLVTATDILYINNEPILDLKKVEWVQNNPQIMDLIGQADRLRDHLDTLESSTDAEFELKGQLGELHRQINFTIGQIYKVVEKLIECQQSDNSEQITRLYKMLLGGDYEGVEKELGKILAFEQDRISRYDDEYVRFKSFSAYYDMYRDLILVRVGGEEGFELACDKYEEEIEISRGERGRLNPSDEAELHMEYGDFLRDRKDERCLEHYESSIDSWKYARNHKQIKDGEYLANMIKCNLCMATYFWGRKNYAPTQQHIDAGLALRDDAKVQGASQIVSDYYLNLAILYDTYGLLCVERVTNTEDGEKLPDEEVRLGLIDAIEQKYDRAVELFGKVDDIRIDSQDALGSVHSNLGRACWQLYKIDGTDEWFERARASLETAIAIRKEVGGLPAVCEPRLVFPINNMGELYFSRAQKRGWNHEDLELALGYFCEAKERLDRHVSYNIQSNGPRAAGVGARIARTKVYMGEHVEAQRLIAGARAEMDVYTKARPGDYVFRLEELADIEREIAAIVSGGQK